MFDRKGSRKYLNESERKAYLEAVTGEPEASCRAFLLTLYYTGCRISEGLNLKPVRIDLTAKAVVFETLKRRKPGHFRLVPVPDVLVELFRTVLDGKGQEAMVWGFSRTTAFRRVKFAMSQAGIKGGMACPKGLRHGYAAACVAKQIPLTTIQKWLGHARLETTAIYLDVAGEEERDLAKRVWDTILKDDKMEYGLSCSMATDLGIITTANKTGMDTTIIVETARATLAGKISFPDVVGALISTGVEYYHVDYIAMRKSFYSADGNVVVTPISYEGLPPVASHFAGDALRENIRDSQQNEQAYRQFTERAMKAGVQGYFAFLRGKRVVYWGRQGEQHIEWFPGSGPKTTT